LDFGCDGFRDDSGRGDRVLTAVGAGQPVVVVNDAGGPTRHAVLMVAADRATPQNVAFVVRHTSGVVCVAMDSSRLEQLELPPMAPGKASDRDFTVSIDARDGTTTGISAADRARTLRVLADPTTRAVDFVRPGHIFPLRVHGAGVFGRTGHAEAARDLAALAGLQPAGAFADLVDDRGEMAPSSVVEAFARSFELPIIRISEVLAQRAGVESVVKAVSTIAVGCPQDRAVLRTFHSAVGGFEPLALVRGEVRGRRGVLVRIQRECVVHDVIGPAPCPCAADLRSAHAAVTGSEAGVLVYLRERGGELRCADQLAELRGERSAELARYRSSLNLVAASVLRDIGVGTVRLLTDDATAAEELSRYAVAVDGIVALPRSSVVSLA
jgi:3,4-dihydroxy 2-butanone 4-phosphate synthase / GTP cyclohydrolase II